MNPYLCKVCRIIIISLFFFNAPSLIAQCAGTALDPLIICDKETDPTLQTFDLFTLLTGETPGGTWIPESNFNLSALDADTGVLNLWNINRFGPHEFTYSSCGDSSTATVTIILGAYAGEDNQEPGDNNVCRDPLSGGRANLFVFLRTIDPGISPDFEGVWGEDPGNERIGLLTEEYLVIDETVPLGTYTFTYTVPAVETCPGSTVIIDVEIRDGVTAGIVEGLSLCSTEVDEYNYTLDLFSRLTEADLNGQWTDISMVDTGEITSDIDSGINVKNIYDNFGAGTYTFEYLVKPDHPVCEEKTSEFVLCIQEEVLGSNTVSNCTNILTITYPVDYLTNGLYDVVYTITGNSFGMQTYETIEYDEIGPVIFNDGTAQIDLLDYGFNFSTSETLTIQIDEIITMGCGLTTCFVIPPADFDVYIEPTIDVTSTSGCELGDIVMSIENTVDASFAPIEGTQSVSYSINGTLYTEDIEFSNGDAFVDLSAEIFLDGSNEFVFFDTNSFIHCGDITTTNTLSLTPSPPNPIFSILPDNRCDANVLQFSFVSPVGESISYNPVTFDIYEIGSEPQQFDPRDPAASLTNNTQGNGTDINLTNSNDVSALPDGEYVFVIRSVQNDDALCRALSQQEIDAYRANDIEIGLAQIGVEHIFDARLTFKIGDLEAVQLIKESFEVCLINGPVTLGDLPITTNVDVDITITDLAGVELQDTYQITQDEVFVTIFKSTVTGCDLGTDQITVKVVSEASTPILNNNLFCSAIANTVADMDTSGQDIVWYNAATGGTAYNSLDVIDANNQYWAEITIPGGCVSTNRTQAIIDFVDKAIAPVPFVNEFCASANPTISDLIVETEVGAIIQWYTSETGPAYASTSLALDNTMQYWVSQTIASGCESDRVQVTFTITDVVMNPEPLANDFCVANGEIYTLDDLTFNPASISREGIISYFSDQAGMTNIPLTESLQDVTSPVYAQQVIAGSCVSDIVEVNFTLQTTALKPVISPIIFCLESNPTIQDLIGLLQNETNSTITLYGDETTTTPLNVNLELNNVVGSIYASQTIAMGCESIEREIVNYTLERLTISPDDFKEVHCAIGMPTLQDVYLGSDNVLWFDQNSDPLLITETLQNGMSYFAQLQVGDCLSPIFEVVVSLVDVLDPVATSTSVDFCGINEKIILDLLEDSDGNTRFNIPVNYNLVWYDSNDVFTRNRLDNETVLQQGVYYAVYEYDTTIMGEPILCESNSLPISVNLTACSMDELIIPDAFSPNGDIYNETFELKNIEFVFPDYSIEIYNRYGTVVYKGDINVGFWDGTSNQPGALSNSVLPTGVYFYIINFNRFDKKPYQGQVYLKR